MENMDDGATNLEPLSEATRTWSSIFDTSVSAIINWSVLRKDTLRNIILTNDQARDRKFWDCYKSRKKK